MLLYTTKQVKTRITRITINYSLKNWEDKYSNFVLCFLFFKAEICEPVVHNKKQNTKANNQKRSKRPDLKDNNQQIAAF